nr:ATP-binding protein [Neobacillus sp. Marseille-Q6967]
MKLTNERIDFHQLVENSLNSIWLVGEDRTILYCNKAGLQLLNYQSMEDVINKSIYLFLPKKIHSLCNSGLTRVMEFKDVIDRLDITILKNHGELAEVELMAVPYYSGDKVFAQVIIQDITDKKMAIKRLNDKEKLASLGQIAAGIVHEVKNPLTAVKGFLQLIKESQSHPYLDTMESELEKAFDTLQKLLQVSKPDLQDEPLVPISLCQKLNMVLLLFQEKMYSVEVELDLKDANRIIIGKKNLFLKAFFNLIKNAFEAINDQGKLKIEHYYENGLVHVRISDTGEGIPADKIKMLGTPFFSSKNDGTGLGLTQVYTTIHEHGGNITVSSEVGMGTTIHIQLPVKQI